jgi:hypothetical protein
VNAAWDYRPLDDHLLLLKTIVPWHAEDGQCASQLSCTVSSIVNTRVVDVKQCCNPSKQSTTFQHNSQYHEAVNLAGA